MRIWARSKIEWICSVSSALWICSLNSVVGPAANGSTSASTIVKSRSGMGAVHSLGTGRQAGEELVYFLPDFAPAAHALPIEADKADELVTLIDGHQKVPSGAAHPVDQQRFDVRFHLSQYRVSLLQFPPGLQRQEGFRGAHRPRVQRHNTLHRSVGAEKGHVDGDAQAFPLHFCH